MAKDDYDVIVYRVLVYLYGCLKRRILFDEVTFSDAVKRHIISEEYLNDVMRMMQQERLIEGLGFKKAWGGDFILITDMREAKITAAGIHYLEDNSKMKYIGNMLKEAADTIATLAGLLSLT